LLKVQTRRGTRRCVSHLDRNGHVPTQLSLPKGLINLIGDRRASLDAFRTVVRAALTAVHRSECVRAAQECFCKRAVSQLPSAAEFCVVCCAVAGFPIYPGSFIIHSQRSWNGRRAGSAAGGFSPVFPLRSSYATSPQNGAGSLPSPPDWLKSP